MRRTSTGDRDRHDNRLPKSFVRYRGDPINNLCARLLPPKEPFTRGDDTMLVQAYHLNDRDIMYLVIGFKVVLWNLRRKTLELVRDFPDHQSSYNAFNFVLPCWPTPIHSAAC